MSYVYEQRFSMGAAIPIVTATLFGLNGSSGALFVPVNFQDLGNSGIPSRTVPIVVGVEVSWIGTPTGSLQFQGNITGLAGTMNNLPATSVLNMAGAPGSGLLFFVMSQERFNYLQILSTLSSGAGTFTAVGSLAYQS